MALDNDDLFEELDNTKKTNKKNKNNDVNVNDINMNDIMKDLKKYKPAELKKMLNSMMGGNKDLQNLIAQTTGTLQKQKQEETTDLKQLYKNKLKAMQKSRNNK